MICLPRRRVIRLTRRSHAKVLLSRSERWNDCDKWPWDRVANLELAVQEAAIALADMAKDMTAGLLRERIRVTICACLGIASQIFHSLAQRCVGGYVFVSAPQSRRSRPGAAGFSFGLESSGAAQKSAASPRESLDLGLTNGHIVPPSTTASTRQHGSSKQFRAVAYPSIRRNVLLPRNCRWPSLRCEEPCLQRRQISANNLRASHVAQVADDALSLPGR